MSDEAAPRLMTPNEARGRAEGPDIDRPAIAQAALERAAGRAIGASPRSFTGQRVYDAEQIAARLLLEIDSDTELAGLRGARATGESERSEAEHFIWLSIDLKRRGAPALRWQIECMIEPVLSIVLIVAGEEIDDAELDLELDDADVEAADTAFDEVQREPMKEAGSSSFRWQIESGWHAPPEAQESPAADMELGAPRQDAPRQYTEWRDAQPRYPMSALHQGAFLGRCAEYDLYLSKAHGATICLAGLALCERETGSESGKDYTTPHMRAAYAEAWRRGRELGLVR